MALISFRILLLSAIIGLFGSSVSLAAFPVNISGFGTLGYSAIDSKEAEYVTGEARDGATDSGTIELDTRLGIQIDKDFSNRLSGTIQGLSRQTYDGKFAPRVEWAFLRAQLNDSVNFRIGRIGVPFFMISDFREVGYANSSLRPPEDTYIQAPLGSFDGLDITSYHELGDTLFTAQFVAGFREQNGPNGSAIEIKDSYGGVFDIDRGSLRLRFSYIRTRLGISDPLASGGELYETLRDNSALVPALVEPAIEFNGQRKPATFAGIGFELNLDAWSFSGEYTQRRLKNSLIGSFDAGYLTAAYRWRDFTPYATVSQLTQTSKTRANLPPIPALAPLEAILNDVYDAGDQQSLIFGLRWDFYDRAALKFQFDQIKSKEVGENIIDSGEVPVPDGETINLYSVALDFIF